MENKKIPVLCSKEYCTACAACFNACPKQAITMQEDECGEMYPIVDESVCIDCGKCEKVCPELNENRLERNGNPDIYCCWLKDGDIRKNSTSGGVAYAISATIINKGGHVWGAAYDEDLYVRYTEANNLEELKSIQKSKYVQSAVGDTFHLIKKELDNGDYVFFAGTGCHVKGLLSFLGKDYPKLYTLDLVCHGVPGQGVFQKYKRWIEKEYGAKVTDYIPRPKRNDGNELGYYSLVKFGNGKCVKMECLENSYFVGFQRNLFLRSACHSCRANGEQRYSDFTVADFWGLGKVEPFKDYKQRTLGISMLALNSEKARSLFADISEMLEYQKRSYKEASYSNTQYYRSSVPSPRRDEFRNDFGKMDWEELANKYMKFNKKDLVLYGIKKFTPPHLLLYVKLLAKWIK